MKKQPNMVLNYKHRIYPNKTQIKLLNEDIFAANQVYNIVLNILQKEYQEYVGFREYVNEFKSHIGQPTTKQVKFNWMDNTILDRKIRQTLNERDLYCPLDVMQGERKVACQAFKEGLQPKNDKGPATFRRSNKLHGAFSWTNARTKLSNKHVLISKRVGNIKIKRERDFPIGSSVRTVRFKKENEQWFVVFSIKLTNKKITEKNFEGDFKDTLGMDTNNGHLDFSDGSIVKYGRSLTIGELSKLKNKTAKKLVKELNKITYLQQKQSNREDICKTTRKKVGRNYYKTQKQINKVQTKIKNRRKNLLDKTSNEVLSKAFSVLILEDLSVKDMTSKTNDKQSKIMSKGKSKQMRKNMLNFSYTTLHNMLSYKAMLTGRLVKSINPRNTTKQCSNCGKLNDMKLSDRTYSCSCGLSIDRDFNSSINIEAKGVIFFEELNSSGLAISV